MGNFINEKLQNFNGVQVNTLEGKSAYQEAIDYLIKVQPLPPLEWNECLAEAALDHSRDLAKNNIFGHDSSDGTSFGKRIERKAGETIYGEISENCDQLKYFHGPDFAKSSIIRYIIDEAVPSRGHRKNIFNKTTKFMGGAMVKNPFSEGGFKSTLDFCSIDVQLKGQGVKK